MRPGYSWHFAAMDLCLLLQTWCTAVNCKLPYIMECIKKLIFRAKYPLAVVEALLDAFGAGIGGGYDIGCQFRTTLACSGLKDRVQKEHYSPLIGSFRHAHNRLCQLSNLATYVKGMGLEDLEGCERFFSRSNALASSVRYSSTFHRRQKINEFMKHMDLLETSQNLSKFLSLTVLLPHKIFLSNRSIYHRQLQTSS